MTRLCNGRQRSGKDGGKERQSKGQEEGRKDGEGRWQRMKLYTHNDPAAMYRADKAAWQQMRLHEADSDVAAYQEIWLPGKDNVL